VSELDGNPALVRRQKKPEPPKSFWSRVTATMEKIFLTPDEAGASQSQVMTGQE
jgi:hypothetical protein